MKILPIEQEKMESVGGFYSKGEVDNGGIKDLPDGRQ